MFANADFSLAFNGICCCFSAPAVMLTVSVITLSILYRRRDPPGQGESLKKE